MKPLIMLFKEFIGDAGKVIIREDDLRDALNRFYDIGFKDGQSSVVCVSLPHKEKNSEGCEGCRYVSTNMYEMPCVDCCYNHNSYFEPKGGRDEAAKQDGPAVP